MASPRLIRHTGIGAEAAKRLRVPRVHRFEKLATVSAQYADGTVTADLPIGPYTYAMQQISLESSVAITGETVLIGGKNIVKTAYISKYVGNVILEINGTKEKELSADRLISHNAFMGYDAQDGFMYLAHGGPHVFHWERAADAYMMGTGNIRSLRLLFQLTNAWPADNSMKLSIMSEYARIRRPISFIETTNTVRHMISGSGRHTITGLSTHSDISRIFVFGASVNRIELIVDDQVVMDAEYQELLAMNALYGRNVAALGDCMLFDFWRDRDVKQGLRALERPDQRKRNADIRMNVWTGAATELEILTENVGTYASQG